MFLSESDTRSKWYAFKYLLYLLILFEVLQEMKIRTQSLHARVLFDLVQKFTL